MKAKTSTCECAQQAPGMTPAVGKNGPLRAGACLRTGHDQTQEGEGRNKMLMAAMAMEIWGQPRETL